MLLFSLNFCLVFDPALPISLIRTPPCALLITAQDAKHYGLMTHYFCQVSIQVYQVLVMSLCLFFVFKDLLGFNHICCHITETYTTQM